VTDTYRIQAFWDVDAKVWVAESQDVPGLATWAANLDDLIAKLVVMIPELLELNQHIVQSQPPLFEVHATKDRERFTVIHAAA